MFLTVLNFLGIERRNQSNKPNHFAMKAEQRNAQIRKQILDQAKGKKPPVDDLEAELNKRTDKEDEAGYLEKALEKNHKEAGLKD